MTGIRTGFDDDMEAGTGVNSTSDTSSARGPGATGNRGFNSVPPPSVRVGSGLRPGLLRQGSARPSRTNLDANAAGTVQNEGTVKLKDDISNLGKWVVKLHFDGLLKEVNTQQHIRGKPEINSDRIFRVSFANLQRMHMRKLQVTLIHHAVQMFKLKDEPGKVPKHEPKDGSQNEQNDHAIRKATINKDSDWEKDLAAYVQAMRDYDYMRECHQRSCDYFLANGENWIDRDVFKRLLGKDPSLFDDKDKTDEVYGPWEDDIDENAYATPIEDTRGRIADAEKLKSNLNRIWIAMVGGAFLPGPMWLMVLWNKAYPKLVVTTICVVFMGAFLCWRLDNPNNVIAGTAAYAAVLDVFVEILAVGISGS